MDSLLDLMDVGYNADENSEGMAVVVPGTGFYMFVPHELILKYLQIVKEVKGHE